MSENANPVSEAFGATIKSLQDHAYSNPSEWTRAGKFIETLASLQGNWNGGLSVSGKEQAGPGRKRGRKSRAELAAAGEVEASDVADDTNTVTEDGMTFVEGAKRPRGRSAA